jgi:enamine deaminase RidA (YjgF/YER057c/UK114 family)
MMEQAMMVKGIDEIAAMCTHQAAMDCVFGGTKTGCASIITAAETTYNQQGNPECLNHMGAGPSASTGTQMPQCVTISDAVKNIMLPQYACLCVDCKYAEYAAVIAPITKRLLTEQDMFPVMKDLTKAMCEKKDTMKCFAGTTGNCGKADKYVIDNMPEQQRGAATDVTTKARKTFYASLDCLCTSCPEAMPKFMTLIEKTEKGELDTQVKQFEQMCGLYPEIGCFQKQSACKEATSMLLSAAGQIGAAPTMTDEEFTKQVEESMKQLKDKCAQHGITVKEYVDDSSEASDAPSLKPSLLPLALLAAAAFVRF